MKKDISRKITKPGKKSPRSSRREKENNLPRIQNQTFPESNNPHPLPVEARDFFIVAIGASAGGLEAFERILQNLPGDTGMAFVFIQHLDPMHESLLASLLSKVTRMPVIEVKKEMPIEPNRIYVISPNTMISIRRGVFDLVSREGRADPCLPIDYFMRSLAEEKRGRAIGIVLSGNGSDGINGLRAIKREGGMTFAQDEASARYEGMPHSAISSNAADHILSPEEIAGELVRIARLPSTMISKAAAPLFDLPENQEILGKIFFMLKKASGVDFTDYKQTTIQRRISRRMVLHQSKKLADYAKYLRRNPDELHDLYQDILINVTSFFRDPEVFEALKKIVFPEMIKNRPPELPIRIWVPGCSSGEEAYSMAISLVEFLTGAASNISVQLFATDIDEKAIEKARTGVYPENIKLDISPERLLRFFTRYHGGYQINKSIRDLCVFAKQDITRDPPFSNIDLVSFRNALIYMEPVLQKKIFKIIHYALKPSGFLLLGTSETIGQFVNYFATLDKKQKIYTKKTIINHDILGMTFGDYGGETEFSGKKEIKRSMEKIDMRKEADRILLTKYSPAGVVIDGNMEILQFRGETGPYLEHGAGEASLNLLKMAREGLLHDLLQVIRKAVQEDRPVKREGLRIRYHQQTLNFNLEVIPIKAPSLEERSYLILFEEIRSVLPSKTKGTPSKSKGGKKETPHDRQVAELKDELAATREYLNSIITEKERAYEDLKLANEQIQSSNEELQSINEEMETAKEELQSTNEELSTLNEELGSRNLELLQVNDDLSNLLGGMNISIVILEKDLRIRRFTPMAEKLMNLIPTDIGRPISDIQPNIQATDLPQWIGEVISTRTPKVEDIQDHEGRWYSMRITPYLTSDKKIDGAVLVLIDMAEGKKSHARGQRGPRRRQTEKKRNGGS